MLQLAVCPPLAASHKGQKTKQKEGVCCAAVIAGAF